ncbi:hypothetical protein CPC08DRAFT_768683 [Agrocybe pediades]|nr:hypothetical protein CPC08DRAFT_768683 [Agrocybe pediades]
MPRTNNSSSASDDEHIEDEYLLDIYKAVKHHDKGHELLDPILKAARGIALTVHPYAKLMPAISAGVPAVKSVLGSESDDEEESQSEIDHAEEIQIYRGLCRLIPHFDLIVEACSKNMHVLRTFIKMLEDASNNGRSIDIYSVTHSIVEWVKLDDRIGYDYEKYSMPKAKELDKRAWWHPEYAILAYPLCGQKDLICPEMLDKIYDLANGEIDVSESEWPYYLYETGTVFNPNDDLNGLFRGYLIPIASILVISMLVYRHVFTGPSSAIPSGPRRNTKSKRNKATLHKVTEVTARTLAYVCTLIRIALRGLGWQLEDGAFEYEVYYQNIVTLLEGTEFNKLSPEEIASWKKWRDELFAWLNEEVNLPQRPGQKTTKKRKFVSTIDGRIVDPVKRHKAQMESRQAQSLLEPSDNSESNPVSTNSSVANTDSKAASTSSPATHVEWPPHWPSRPRPLHAQADSDSVEAAGPMDLVLPDASALSTPPPVLPVATASSMLPPALPAAVASSLSPPVLLVATPVDHALPVATASLPLSLASSNTPPASAVPGSRSILKAPALLSNPRCDLDDLSELSDLEPESGAPRLLTVNSSQVATSSKVTLDGPRSSLEPANAKAKGKAQGIKKKNDRNTRRTSTRASTREA